MAVYFDHRINWETYSTYKDVSIHNKEPLVAVAGQADSGCSVALFEEEGETLPGVNLQRPYRLLCMQWHPHKKILATGWESGEVLTWNEQEHELYEAVQLHKSEITLVCWTSNGSRLLTADATGTLITWKSDSRGRLQQQPLSQHPLSEPVVQAILRPVPTGDAMDIASLARAAVSGDEAALDMFNWKKGKNSVKISAAALGQQESLCFFIGGANGGVYYLNENGKCTQCFIAEGEIRTLLFYEEKNILVTVTNNLMLTQHSVSSDGLTRDILKVKLSGKSQEPHIIWAGKGLLATATGENIVRMWDLDKEDNFILTLEGQSGFDTNEIITCVAFNQNKNILAGGTGMGHVIMWKYNPHAGSKVEPEDRWQLQPPSTLEGPIGQICWGSSKDLLAVNTTENVFILSEQIMSAYYREGTAIVQTGPMELSVDLFDKENTHHSLKTDIQVKGVCCTKENLAILNGKRVVVYEITSDKSLIRAAGTFASDSTVACMYEQSIYLIEPGKVQVRTFQGTVKQLLNFTDNEGDPVCMNICSQHLVVGSSQGVVKVFDLSRREAKASSSPKNLLEVIPDFGSIVSVQCNCTGSKVSIIAKQSNQQPDPKMYIWDVETDTVQFFSFQSGHGEQDEFITEDNDSDLDVTDEERGKNQAAKDIAGRYPISHHWDPTEAKLLVCEAKILSEKEKEGDNQAKKKISLTKASMEEVNEIMVVSLFATQENGILIQDSFALEAHHNSLLGLEVPYYYFVIKPDVARKTEPTIDGENGMPSNQVIHMVSRKSMRDFVGLETADKGTRDAMMNFSYYLTIGNMDEAFKAIKLIKSESVWENMAKMCVKNRRLDVASVCLGNMGHARGAKALRETHGEPELDARVAMLAVQLCLHEDAERLLKNCKRYDLLNEYYQNSCQWGKAMETAELYDRIHLRTTYFNYARHLESKGDYNTAIPNYEKSNTHRFEVPRMLFEDGASLENYIRRSRDKALKKWWAQYMESTSEMEIALQFYEAAEDFLSLVRVYCYCGNLEKAAEICNQTGDKAACYHMGRQYENTGQIPQAVHFYNRAGAYGNAIRLCKDNADEADQMMNLALLGRPEDMVEAARFFESKPDLQDKAVLLYHKAGHYSKALDLAFTAKQFGALQLISEDLSDTTDPELLQRCAQFFIENGQFDRAVDLLGIGKKYWEALKICAEQHVDMTEDLAEKLSPPKDTDAEERNRILEGIAEVCMQQREYHIATKKYTQAGNKVKAMKALLKSGDTEKIVFFAGVSRQKEIYIMAANYLQSLDWRKDPEIMKNIIGFYTKGRALDLLAGFYDACAQVEIDEYQNYDKALGALGEAAKCLAKAKMKNQSLQEEKLADIKQRMGIIKKFVQARRSYEDDSEDAIKQCQVLLQEPGLDTAVRAGDVYGFIVEHYAKKEKWKLAYNTMDEMKSKLPKVNLTYYINAHTIESTYTALGMPTPTMNGIHDPTDNDISEEVEEDVIDDMYP